MKTTGSKAESGHIFAKPFFRSTRDINDTATGAVTPFQESQHSMGRVRWPIFWPEISVTIILRTSLRDIAAISGLKCLKPHLLDVRISAKGFDAVNLGEGAGIRLQHLSRNAHCDRMPRVSAKLFPTSNLSLQIMHEAARFIPMMRRLINANYTTVLFLVRQAFKAELSEHLR